MGACFFAPHAGLFLVIRRDSQCLFLVGEALPFCFAAGLVSVFSYGNLLLVACPYCFPILDLYSVNSLVLVKNGIDFLNMPII